MDSSAEKSLLLLYERGKVAFNELGLTPEQYKFLFDEGLIATVSGGGVIALAFRDEWFVDTDSVAQLTAIGDAYARDIFQKKASLSEERQSRQVKQQKRLRKVKQRTDADDDDQKTQKFYQRVDFWGAIGGIAAIISIVITLLIHFGVI